MVYNLSEAFGQRLKKVRKERKMFRFQVARMAGCEAKLIQRLEKGHARTISSVQLRGICNALEISPETILTETEE